MHVSRYKELKLKSNTLKQNLDAIMKFRSTLLRATFTQGPTENDRVKGTFYESTYAMADAASGW